MHTENQAFGIQSIVRYCLGTTLAVLTTVYGLSVFKTISIAQPALF